MLEIAKLNGETSNNNASLVAAMLTISIAKLAAAALAIPIIATSLKLTTLAILVIATPLKRSAYKATRGCAASVGGRTLARRSLTGTILGNQAMEQQTERICKTKATMKERIKACTHKSRNRNGTIRLVITVYDY
jgi:hypothetical protein